MKVKIIYNKLNQQIAIEDLEWSKINNHWEIGSRILKGGRRHRVSWHANLHWDGNMWLLTGTCVSDRFIQTEKRFRLDHACLAFKEGLFIIRNIASCLSKKARAESRIEIVDK